MLVLGLWLINLSWFSDLGELEAPPDMACGGLASGSSGVSPPVERDVRGEEPEGVRTQGSGSSDEFHEEEWKAAEAKLRAVEINHRVNFCPEGTS